MSQSGNYTRRVPVSWELPHRTLDRLEYLRQVLGEDSDEDLVCRAIRLLDRVVCCVTLEGGEAVLRERSGRQEVLDV